MSQTVRALFILGLGLLISACSITPIDDPDQRLISATEAPQNWHARGRFAYSSEQEKRSGQFDWRQQGSDYQIRLFGPLGMSSTRISGSSEGVEVESEGESFFSNQPDQLFFELTGMHIPIEELSHWMTGVSPAQQSADLNWQVKYDDYRDIEQHRLPSRIDLSNPITDIRIAISEWSLGLED